MATLQDINQNKLNYFIHKCSGYTPSYIPENIQDNKPHDAVSRWCSQSTKLPQFLVLKLQKVSIVTKITFGKYEKSHACNVKKFKVLGGLLEDNLLELLESGLKNDSTPETFELRHEIGGRPLPARFIKIVPLLSWTPSSYYSIWFVELFGVDNWTFVKPCIEWFNVYREREVVRHCLRHFRDLRYTNALETLASETGIQLEDPALTHLHEALVQRGDFECVERLMTEAVASGALNGYLTEQDYIPEWSTVPERSLENVAGAGADADSSENQRPGMRGGHQMCLDPITETIYLFGGWDGNQDLSDFWSYHITSRTWTLISKNTESEGGPSARSCHKVCLDPERRQMFTLGRYLDPQYRQPQNLKSDFYVYDIDSNTWTLITDDTASMGGPHLVFDHQMCMDVQKRKIHVFGGRLLIPPEGIADDRAASVHPPLPDVEFSGLYTYEVATNTWTKVWDDNAAPGVPIIKSRVGHSMVFHPMSRKLFIFAGQRGKEYLNDFFTLDVDTRQIQAVNEWSNDVCVSSPQGITTGPAAGFTRRATIDPELDEIYVLSGMCREKGKRGDNVHNSFWVYSIRRNQWLCVYRNEDISDGQKNTEPCPRFAHQLVYDPVGKSHYLFGGNPGRMSVPTLRLDDFWRLCLRRPSQAHLNHAITLMIRKHRFVELAAQDKLAALEYLQTDLADVIDHNNMEQTKEFHLLPWLLFQSQYGDGCEVDGENDQEANAAASQRQRQRSALFHQLGAFFPPSMTQPKSCLLDLIPL